MALRRDRIEQAFASAAWRESARAFRDATGLAITVTDLRAGRALATTGRCGHCHLIADGVVPGPIDCYDTPPTVSADVRTLTCRGGIATVVAPVDADGGTAVHLIITGFVSSTRERKKLYERLMGRGVREEVARLAVRGLPMVTRREIEAHARLACTTARSVLDGAERGDSAAPASPPVADPLSLLLDTTVVAGGLADDPSALASRLLEGAQTLFDAEAGTIAVCRSGGYVEVVASNGDEVRPRGTKMRLEGGAAQRAIETGRTAVIAREHAESAAPRMTVVTALASGQGADSRGSTQNGRAVGAGAATGTLELRFAPKASPSADDIRRIERFARYAGLSIGAAERSVSLSRALSVATRADELGAALGSETDAVVIAQRVLAAIGNVLTCNVAGVIVTSWGRDRVDAALSTDITSAEFAMLLGEAAGRDVEEHPFAAVAHHQAPDAKSGAIVESSEVRDGWTFLSTPLSTSDRLVGFLLAAARTPVRFGAHDADLLEGLARHAAGAFERAELLGQIRDDLAKTVAMLSSSLDTNVYEDVAGGPPSSARRGSLTPRVMEYAMLIGEELDLDMEQIERLRFAGLLHDVGTTGVTEEVLLKPIQLSDDEIQRVRMHTELGVTVMEQIELIRELTPVILHHHEHWDGSGTPSGLAGRDIPLLARILGVADAFDAMTSGRQRRSRTSFAAAQAELEARSGSVFDPDVVNALSSALNRQALVGAAGLLSPAPSKRRRELPA